MIIAQVIIIKINFHQQDINDPSINYQTPKMLTSLLQHFSTISRILTGIQPTGSLTLGNYIGSICNYKNLQTHHPSSQNLIFIADLHSLTTSFDLQHDQIKYDDTIGNNTIAIAKTILSSGILNNKKSIIFVQSQIKQHTQLCWLLGCISPQYWLNMMIQYKQKYTQNSSLGIYSYPVLMAADILLYKANYIPVGQDQKQHLELTKKFVQRFNSIFNTQFFPTPTCIISNTPKIMSLVNPQKKMSKSDKNQRSRINLTDTKDLIAQKIRRSVTDSQGHHITYQPQRRLGLANLIRIYSSLENISHQSVVQKFVGKGIKDFKFQLVQVIWKILFEIQRNTSHLSDEEVIQKLKQGASHAQPIASQTITQIKTLLKLYK